MRGSLDSFLRFDVAVEDAVPMHVFDRLQQLINVEFYSRLRQVIGPALNGLIEVHLHEVED